MKLLKISSSSSSSCAGSMGCHDFPSPVFPIGQSSRYVLCVISRILKKLLNVGLCWSAYTGRSIYRVPQEYVTYEFILSSPAVSSVSCSPLLNIYIYIYIYMLLYIYKYVCFYIYIVDLAQSVQYLPKNHKVLGSIPALANSVNV